MALGLDQSGASDEPVSNPAVDEDSCSRIAVELRAVDLEQAACWTHSPRGWCTRGSTRASMAIG